MGYCIEKKFNFSPVFPTRHTLYLGTPLPLAVVSGIISKSELASAYALFGCKNGFSTHFFDV
jgi:hypothetical protein